MEIIVQGKGESLYTPNQVVFHLNFFVKASTYEDALTRGSNNVLDFIAHILLLNGFAKEDMKTNTFLIKKEQSYNQKKSTYDFVGYSYNQSATIIFEYDKIKLSKLMEEISKMDNPPFYNVEFTIKDLKECKKENLAKAYKDAEEQAEMIAQAAGKKLMNCVKTDFKPFTTDYISRGYDSDTIPSQTEHCIRKQASIAETINEVFTPEDVKVKEMLYCLWIAE